MLLRKPAFYFPIERPLYEVSAGLKPFGFDFGNSDLDQKIFQIDHNFQSYRQNKIECRHENLNKYFTHLNLPPDHAQTLAQFIIARLTLDYPEIFELQQKQNEVTLKCLHTHDQIIFNTEYTLIHFISVEKINPSPLHLLDALALQIPEDFALLCLRPDGSNDLSLLHLCSASHWAAKDKIGKPFIEVHKPIPHIEKINKTSENIIQAMIHKGPFVRFAWSFVTDTRLNHNPIPPPGIDPIVWKGRSFNKDFEIPFYIRIERQVIYGFPKLNTSFFGIGITFVDALTIKKNETMKNNLIGALLSMSSDSQKYKGIDHCFNDLIEWLSKP